MTKAINSGNVVTLRVNPKDSMSIVDLLKYLDVPLHNLSFNQAVKIALSSALASFRAQGILPEHDGFDYTQVMSPFASSLHARRGKKLISAHVLNSESFQAAPIIDEDYDRKKRRLRYNELTMKRRADPDNFSEAEQEEFVPLVEEFFT